MHLFYFLLILLKIKTKYLFTMYHAANMRSTVAQKRFVMKSLNRGHVQTTCTNEREGVAHRRITLNKSYVSSKSVDMEDGGG